MPKTKLLLKNGVLNGSNNPNISQKHTYPIGLLTSLPSKGDRFNPYAPHYLLLFSFFLLNPRINGDTAKPSHKDNKYCHKNIN